MSVNKDSAEDNGRDKYQGNKDHKPLTPAAKRALAEAAERRRKMDAEEKTRPVEIGGRDGPDPVRYGDWEKDGIISDF